jgi:hypothetical protein
VTGLFARLVARSRGDVAGAVRAVVPPWFAPPIDASLETEVDAIAPPAAAEAAPDARPAHGVEPGARAAAVAAPDARPAHGAEPGARAAAGAVPSAIERRATAAAVSAVAPGSPPADVDGTRGPAAVSPALPGRAAQRGRAPSADPGSIEPAELRAAGVELDAPLVPRHAEPAAPPRVAEPVPPPSPPSVRDREAPQVTGETRRSADLPQVESRAVVRVTIGRIDVRAVTAPSAPPRPPPRPAAGVGLADYLGRRDRGER